MLDHGFGGFAKTRVAFTGCFVSVVIAATGIAQFDGAYRLENIRFRRHTFTAGQRNRASRFRTFKPIQQFFRVFTGEIRALQAVTARSCRVE